MMKYPITITSVLGLSLALALDATAQTADTLKRQLQVETSEELTLQERMPLGTNLQAPTAYKAHKITSIPIDLRGNMPPLDLAPLKLMTAPQAFYYNKAQRGYVELAGGLKYNAYLSAGFRAIDKENTKLNFVVDGLYTNYDIKQNDLKWQGKEQKLELKAHYTSRQESGLKYGIDASYMYHKYNYHGYIPLEQNTGTYDPTLLIGKPFLTNNQYRIAGSLGQLERQEGLSYYFRPELSYSQIDGLGFWEQNRQSNELKLSIDAQLRYYTGDNHYLGLLVKSTNYMYNKSAEELGLGTSIYTYSNKSLLTMQPFWNYQNDKDQLDWGVHVGLALDFYQEYKHKGVMLSPYLTAYLNPNDDWSVKLEAKGGVKMNSLSEMLQEMPYLRIMLNTLATRTPLDLKLSAKGLLNPQIGIEGFVQYAQYKDAINYALTPTALPGSLSYGSTSSALDNQGAFITERANGSVLRVGGGVDYRFSKFFTLRGALTYNHWSRGVDRDTPALYGRPNFEINASLSYRPNKFVELIGGYELKYGLQQKVYSLHREQMFSLPTISLLNLSAVYNIDASWTLKGSAQFLSHAEATMYYGYMPQRFAATIGISYCF